MVVEGLVTVFYNMLRVVFSGLEFVGLPYQFINVLSTILSYGIWVVGADVMAIFISTIVTWWIIKFTVGILLWIWELLPIT